jgi:hypothetical protein
MNKLITTNPGGFPFVLDDLRFIDESVREVLKSNFSRFLDPNNPNDKGFLIEKDLLRGSAFNNKIGGFNGQAMPEMFAFISGEIFYLPAQTLPTGISPSSKCYVEIDISFSGTAPGQKVFENGNSVETYQIRRAKYTLTPTTTDFFELTSSSPISPSNLFDGYDFEFNENCSLIQREYISLRLDTYENNISSIFQSLSLLLARTTALENIVNPIVNNDWINVPYSVLMRSTNPVIYLSGFSDETDPSGLFSLVSIGSLSSTNYFFRLKRIGKTVICSININNLSFPGFPTASASGILIDLNNLGLTNFVGGSMKNFKGYLTGKCDIPSPASNTFEVVPFNNLGATNRNGIFLRLQNGTDKTFAQLNLNYYHQVQNAGAYTNIVKTKLIADYDNYPTSASWDISGTLIFEMY